MLFHFAHDVRVEADRAVQHEITAVQRAQVHGARLAHCQLLDAGQQRIRIGTQEARHRQADFLRPDVRSAGGQHAQRDRAVGESIDHLVERAIAADCEDGIQPLGNCLARVGRGIATTICFSQRNLPASRMQVGDHLRHCRAHVALAGRGVKDEQGAHAWHYSRIRCVLLPSNQL